MKAITLSGSAVFAALQGFPWRAATVLMSEKSSEIDLESQWLGYPPRPSQTRGIGSHLRPTSISIPNPILCPGAAAAPGSPGRRRDGNTKAGSVCILSSATPAAAGRWSECSKGDRDGHTRGIRVSREQNSIATGHAHWEVQDHPLLWGSHIPNLVPDAAAVPARHGFSVHLKAPKSLSWTLRIGTKQATALYASDIIRSFTYLVL